MRKSYDCAACPAVCCTVYESVSVDDRDVGRLAAHANLPADIFAAFYTRQLDGSTVLRRKNDPLSGTGRCCTFLDVETRRCPVYDARPEVCRDFPAKRAQEAGRCAYYDLLTYVRRESGDDSRVPPVQIKRLVA